MRFRRSVRGKRVFKGKRKVFRKSRRSIRNTKHLTIRSTIHQPIASSLRVPFETCGNMYISSGVATSHFIVQANTLYYNHGGAQLGPLADSTAGPGNYLGGATNSTLPTGFTQYCDPNATIGVSLYNRYVVTGCKLTITMTPQSGADALILAISPISGYGTAGPPNYPSYDLLYSDVDFVASSPHGKMIQCTGNNNIRQNTLSMYIDIAKFFGITRKMLLTEDFYAGLRNESDDDDAQKMNCPNKTVGFLIYARNQTNSNWGNNVPYQVKLKHYVELSQPSNTSLSVA